VFEDGGQLRDFVHVRDVARSNAIALESRTAARGSFNIATGHPRSVREMASALADAYGPDAPRPETTGAYRLGDVRHVFASPRRAADVLGFTAAVDFEAGLRELLDERPTVSAG
jgi:dTDP-L-rhamnose 4-epimerase